MIIHYEFRKPTLHLVLKAYSFNRIEFVPLENVIRASVGEVYPTPINQDSFGRLGQQYEIINQFVSKFEHYLGVKFFPDKVELINKGQPFKCKELKLGQNANGCKTFYAEDLDRAKTKCSLVIAKEEGWFSGEAEHGECKQRG